MSNDNDGVEPKDIVENIEKLPTKPIEIILKVLNSIFFVLLLIDLIIIKWNDFSKNVLILAIFYFIIVIILLIFCIILRYWRAKNLIKTDKKRNGKIIALIGVILSLTLIVLSQIEDYLIEKSLDNSKKPCEHKTIYDNYPYNYKYKNLYNSTIVNIDIRRKLETCPTGQDFIRNIRLSDEIMIKINFGILLNFSFVLFGSYIIILNRIRNGQDEPEKKKIFIDSAVQTLDFSELNYKDKNKNNKLYIRDDEQNKNNYETMNSQEKVLK